MLIVCPFFFYLLWFKLLSPDLYYNSLFDPPQITVDCPSLSTKGTKLSGEDAFSRATKRTNCVTKCFTSTSLLLATSVKCSCCSKVLSSLSSVMQNTLSLASNGSTRFANTTNLAMNGTCMASLKNHHKFKRNNYNKSKKVRTCIIPWPFSLRRRCSCSPSARIAPKPSW